MGTYQKGADCPILYHLCADDRIAEERPEGGGNKACVDRSNGGEGGGALLKEGTRGYELEGEGEEVEDEEYAELDATWGESVRRGLRGRLMRRKRREGQRE